MTALIGTIAWLAGPASSVWAQPAVQASRAIRCASCPLSGYRVTHDLLCPAAVWYCKTCYGLEIEEIQSIEARLRAQAGRTYVITGYSGPSREIPETRVADPARLPELGLALNGTGSPYLWTSDMGTGLAGLPPEGSRISKEEYDRHKPVYFAILKNLESGVDLIENGFVFEHLRVCRIQPGIADGCEIR
jgi:hypothetical protein